jgi:hypothetical protein
MIADFGVRKQPSQQGEGVLREGRVNKKLLALQCLSGAKARFSVVVEIWIHDLRKELRRRPQAEFCPAIPLVKWLTQDELSAIGLDLGGNDIDRQDLVVHLGYRDEHSATGKKRHEFDEHRTSFSWHMC